MRDDLLKKIENLGAKLPNNTLDQLIDELGGPNDVAEVLIIVFNIKMT